MEKIWQWLARRLPSQLVYFAAIRLVAYATCAKYSKQSVTEVTAMDAVKRWEDKL